MRVMVVIEPVCAFVRGDSVTGGGWGVQGPQFHTARTAYLVILSFGSIDAEQGIITFACFKLV